MIKKRFLLFLLMLPLMTWAQNTDGGATPIMQALAQKYKSYTSFKFDYTLKVEKDKKTLSTSSGTLTSKGNKYYCTFKDQTYYCDGKSIWNYQKSTNEVSIFEYDETDNNIMNPAKLLANWNKEYKAKFIREEVVDGNYLQIIDLTPIKKQSFYRVRFKINKVKKTLVSVILYENDNTMYSYHINKMTPNIPVDDAFFVFQASKYPGVDINDMR